MDGLDEFEKSLAAEKAEREKGEDRRHRKHKHRDDPDREDRHRRRRHHDEEEQDGSKGHRHRHKRSRRPEEDGHDSKTGHSRDKSRDRDSHDTRRSPAATSQGRDAWMMAPSALDVEHVHRPERKAVTPPPQQPKRVIHSRELNNQLESFDGEPLSSGLPPLTHQRKIDYTFGDAGSSWRMTKLRGVFTTAESSGRPVEDVAVERYGSLEDFDDAREEKEEMERRRIYGAGYSEKEKPTGDLYREREHNKSHEQQAVEQPESGTVIPEEPARLAATDPTSLNRLRAQMMKAKLRRAPNAQQLQDEYNRAAALAHNASAPDTVVLGIMDAHHLAGQRNEVKPVETKRGRQRNLVQENTDMSIDDMVREERLNKHSGDSSGLRLAQRIAKDGQYDNTLEYMDDNAAKLATRVHQSSASLRDTSIAEFQKLNRQLDKCPLCHHETKPPVAPIVSLATRVFLTLPTTPEVSPGGAVIVPITHHRNLVSCDDDEWEELRNFMKALTRLYHSRGQDVLFYENAARPNHAALVAVPIPYAEGATAPAHFREAFLSADEEWAQHRKVIDTGALARGGMGRAAFRKSIAKEVPYFHVWFDLDGGMGHVVEDGNKWPRGDLFAREVVGGIVGAEGHVVKKQGRWVRGEGNERVDAWRREWSKFDWTRML